jgi:hypothetical protein
MQRVLSGVVPLLQEKNAQLPVSQPTVGKEQSIPQ